MAFSGLTRWFMQHVLPIVEDAVTSFTHALLQDIQSSGGELLTNTALSAVHAAEANGGSGSDKFSAALESVKDTLRSQGVEFVENAVQGAILAGVAQLHATQAFQVTSSEPLEA